MTLRTFHGPLLGLLMLAIPAAAHAQAWKQTSAVAMPDGITLSTDVWKGLIDTAKHPVLLRRTPYGRAVDTAFANNLVNAGYVLVSQDVRGAGDSGGKFVPFFDDKIDGKATIDWVAAQSFSNGRVGTYSASAEGIVQYMAMASAPAALSCAHIAMPSHDVYEALFPGGAWRTDVGTNWLHSLKADDVITLWKAHEVHDAFWAPATLSTTEMQAVKHPVFIMGGMFDIFAPSEVRAWNELRANVDPAARADVFLILGPWTHGGATVSQQGELQFPADAAYQDYGNDLLGYFEWCLRDAARPSFPPVRYYETEITDDVQPATKDTPALTVAKGSWKQADAWPPVGATSETLYVQADGSLRGPGAPDAAPPVPLPVDPANLVPSLGGGNLSTDAGPYDQRTVDVRKDVFVATSDPMTADVEIAGNAHATVWASSATTDVDVVVRLEAVTAGGKAIALTDGVRRGRFLQGDDAVRPLRPNVPVAFEVPLGPAALLLPKGQSLRIAIAATSTPRYEPNPGVAVPLASAGDPIATTLTLYRDRAHPSRLDLPVTRGTLPGAVATPAGGGADADAGPAPEDDAGARPAGDDPLDADRGAHEPGGGAGNPASPDGGSAGPDGATGGCGCKVSGRAEGYGPVTATTLALLALWLLRRTP